MILNKERTIEKITYGLRWSSRWVCNIACQSTYNPHLMHPFSARTRWLIHILYNSVFEKNISINATNL